MILAHLSILVIQDAEAGRIQVGLGVQDSFDAIDNPGRPDGLRLSGRYHLGQGPLTAEGGMYLASPFAPEASETVGTLLQIAHQGDPDAGFQQPFQVDRMGVHAAVDVSPILTDRDDSLTCAPHVLAGLTVTQGTEWNATYDDDYTSGGSNTPVHLSGSTAYLHLRPVIAFGMDAWWEGRVGMRMLFQLRPGMERRPNYDPNDSHDYGNLVTLDAALIADLMIGFGR